MKKNSQLHIWLETELKENLERQAKEHEVSLCEFCRRKLIESPVLTRIEMKLDNLMKKNSILKNKGLFKAKELDGSNINSR